jgi:anti-sigma regulatory factor (Ser/Thr protein kinase)
VSGATSSVTLRLAARPEAPAQARRSLVAACRGIAESLLEDAQLLVSELVGNCVRHAGGMITVVVECDSASIAVAVADESPDPPQPRAAPPDACGGRGLVLLDRLATAWGHRAGPDGIGKVVWFRLAR